MATGALDANGVWQYGEDDSEATFSALLNKLGSSVSTQIGRRKVLQVVNNFAASMATSTSTTPASTGLTATITPISSTSKILVSFNQSGLAKVGNTGVAIRLQRGATTLSNVDFYAGYDGTTGTNHVGSVSFEYLDSPATTSPVTYTTQFFSVFGTGTVYVQATTATSTITLIEVTA